jgi:hypothetical protein
MPFRLQNVFEYEAFNECAQDLGIMDLVCRYI